MSKFNLERLADANPRPRICLVGDSGAGKTHAMLSLPGHKIVVDAENGMRAFKERFPDAMRLKSQDPHEVRELIDAISNGHYPDCSMFGVDPISTIWSEAQDQVGDYEVRKAQSRSRRQVDELDVDLSFASWRKIKGLNRRIIVGLRRLDMPVVVTCRSKVAGEARSDAFNGMVPDAEKSLIYEFDTVIWMTNTDGRRKAFVTKDRWGRLPREITGSVHEAIIEAFPKQFGADIGVRVRPVPTDEQRKEWNRLLVKLAIEPDKVSAALRHRGVRDFEDLTPEKAEELLQAMRVKAKEVKVEPPQEGFGDTDANIPT